MRFALLALALLSLPLAAQTPEDSLGFSDLEADIRATTFPGELYFRQLDEAWDRAIVAGQFGRADSVAVLAETYLVETQGTPRDSVIWPSIADRFALGLLAGDLWAVRWLAADGDWWSTPTSTWYPRTDVFYTVGTPRLTLLPGPRYGLRFSTANTLIRDSSEVPQRLAARGASEEELALARLAVAKLLVQPAWGGGYIDVSFSDAQKALNERADAFLERYPNTPYARFVREEVRVRYDVKGSVALTFGFGPGWGSGNLADATNTSIAGEISLGLRYKWGHAAFGIHGGDLNVAETRVGTDGTELVETDRLSVGLLSVEAGPRLAVGGLDVLPYVAGGLLLRGVSAQKTDDDPLSSYSPGTRLGWGYGVGLEYLGDRRRRYGGTAVRLRVSRIMPRFDRGFETVLDGPITSVTLGLSLAGMIRSRSF
ncbi:outer membrane protein [Rubricoccus marinus]|uniref:Outer membrane protein beta-barrel domain-containing protein n=1 Tax=Rubricoccus marinus TaxID=716817 RepID=A0A259U0X2_9BACT|nr:outer membrane beta-barrel protein [Rubricoccus marinus]OZC03497.1 hypothetical protein BSZ36_11195 [Rubricoccus marinus]